MYVYGQLLRAAAETLGADPSTAADKFTGRLWYNTATELLKYTTTAGAIKSLVDTDSTQTLTNKTYDAEGTGNVLSNITDTHIKATAAIAHSKMLALTPTMTAITDASGFLTAGAVSEAELNTLIGVAGNVQTQIQGNADAITAHESATAAHGATGAVVGTTNSQTLTNKTLTSPIMATIVNGGGTLTLPSSTDTLVGRDTTDTLTNKTLTSPTLTSPGIDVAVLDGQASAPANPSSGFYKLYVSDTTQKLTLLDSAGTSTTVGAGGAGGINYISGNPDAEAGTSGWVAGSDALMVFSTNTVAETMQFYNRTTATKMIGPELTHSFVLGGTVANGGLTLGTTYYLASAPFAPVGDVFTSSGALYGVTGVALTSGGGAVNLTSSAGNGLSWLQPTVFYGGSGTVVTPGITWTRSTSSPQVGTGSFLLTKPATNCVGEFVAYDFTIDSAYQGQQLAINALFGVVSGTYASNDIKFRIFDRTNGVAIEPSAGNLPNTGIAGPIQPMVFQTASNSVAYRLVLWVSTQSTAAYTLKFDNFSVGPQIVPVGAAMTNKTAVTVTGTWTTNTTYQCFEKIVGDEAFYEGQITLAGAPGGTAAFGLNMPAGRTIDLAKLPANLTYNVVGECDALDSGTTEYSFAKVTVTSSTALRFCFQSAGTNADTGITSTAPFTFGSGDKIWFRFSVPIVGLSSNTIVSDSAASRVVAAKMYRGTAQTGIAPNNSSYKINVDTVSGDTHGMADTSNNRLVVKVPGAYTITGHVATAGTNILASQYVAGIYKNGAALCFSGAIYPPVAGSVFIGASCIDPNAVVGDYYELFLYGLGNNSASTLTSSTGIAGCSLSANMIQGPAQIQAATIVAAKYTWGATQSLTSGGAFTTFNPNTKAYDTTGMNSSGTLTIPSAGKYRMSFTVYLGAGETFASVNNTINCYYQVDNTTRYFMAVFQPFATATAIYQTITGTSTHDFIAGQTVFFEAQNTDSAAKTVSAGSSFSIERLGGVN